MNVTVIYNGLTVVDIKIQMENYVGFRFLFIVTLILHNMYYNNY